MTLNSVLKILRTTLHFELNFSLEEKALKPISYTISIIIVALYYTQMQMYFCCNVLLFLFVSEQNNSRLGLRWNIIFTGKYNKKKNFEKYFLLKCLF